MNDTSKAIIIASTILAIAIIASAWIFDESQESTHRYSLMETNNKTYDALKINHKTGQAWYIRQGTERKVRTTD